MTNEYSVTDCDFRPFYSNNQQIQDQLSLSQHARFRCFRARVLDLWIWVLDLEASTSFWWVQRLTAPTCTRALTLSTNTDKRIPGYVTGYVRRFWQASQDHRGTPEAPGRVVTLIERSFWETLSDHHPPGSDKVWGTAYRIKAENVAEVRDYLDIREINGYTIDHTSFYPSDGGPTIKTLVYIGTPDNDQFVGPQDPQRLAEHIHKSVGPSGLNKDYLLSLEEALEGLSSDSGDQHVKDLAERLRKLEQWNTINIPGESLRTKHVLGKFSSTDEQEETEK